MKCKMCGKKVELPGQELGDLVGRCNSCAEMEMETISKAIRNYNEKNALCIECGVKPKRLGQSKCVECLKKEETI